MNEEEFKIQFMNMYKHPWAPAIAVMYSNQDGHRGGYEYKFTKVAEFLISEFSMVAIVEDVSTDKNPERFQVSFREAIPEDYNDGTINEFKQDEFRVLVNTEHIIFNEKIIDFYIEETPVIVENNLFAFEHSMTSFRMVYDMELESFIHNGKTKYTQEDFDEQMERLNGWLDQSPQAYVGFAFTISDLAMIAKLSAQRNPLDALGRTLNDIVIQSSSITFAESPMLAVINRLRYASKIA